MPSKVLSGARCRFSINGVKVGWALSVSVDERIQHERIKVMDSIEVKEDVPVDYEVSSFRASQVRLVGETLKAQGWIPKTGQNAEEHLRNILVQGELTAQIEDNQTGQVIATLERCRAQGHSWSVNARGIVNEEIDFLAIRQKDESEI